VDLSEDELLERRRNTWDLLFKSSGIITSVTIATTLMRSRGAVSYYKISPPPTGGVVDRQWWKNTNFELMVEHEAGEEEHSGEIDAEHDGSTHKRKAEQTEVSSKKRIARETNSATAADGSDEPSSAADDDDDAVSDSDFVAEDNSGSDSDSDEDTVPEAGSSTGEDDAGSESASDINERTSDSE
jgi:hypothetical protein